MAYMMNSASFIGRLTDDIKIKKSKSGKEYCSFTLAVQRTKEDCDFIDVVAFGSTAGFIEKYNGEKGLMLGIIGRLETGLYDDSDGIRRKSTKVIAQEITLIGRTSSTKETE